MQRGLAAVYTALFKEYDEPSWYAAAIAWRLSGLLRTFAPGRKEAPLKQLQAMVHSRVLPLLASHMKVRVRGRAEPLVATAPGPYTGCREHQDTAMLLLWLPHN